MHLAAKLQELPQLLRMHVALTVFCAGTREASRNHSLATAES